MNSFLLSALLLAAATITVSAQTTAPTTQEEYNYATKGLKDQRSKGLDMKAGYAVLSPSTSTMGVYTVVIEDLVRKADNSLAGVIVEVNNSTWANNPGPRYFCIPNSSSSTEIKQLYFKDVQLLSTIDIHQIVNYAIANRLAEATGRIYKSK